MVLIANAKAEALKKVGETLKTSGGDAAALSVAEQYVKAFSELAKTNNTLILPADTANISSTVAQVCVPSLFSPTEKLSFFYDRPCKSTKPCPMVIRSVAGRKAECEIKSCNIHRL